MTSIVAAVGNTPLVLLQRISEGLPVPIYGKCEFLNPTGSGKDRIAKSIVEDAESRGLLSAGDTLVEATAGNTGLGLAMMAAARGYQLVCVMPEKMSPDKRVALRAAGAEVIIADNAPLTDPRNFQNVARRLASERGWFLTDQFANTANTKTHESTTGPEIAAQCPDLGAFVCGIGTGGTITGVARSLRRLALATHIVLADPIGSRLAHQIDASLFDSDAPYLVEGIGGSAFPAICDPSLIDVALQVSDAESFATARRLITEEGLFVGGSSGTAVAAAIRYAKSGGAAKPIVALLADSANRYATCPWFLTPV